MAATLKLTHKAIGAEVRRDTYDVLVGGDRVGSVEMNDTLEIPLKAGSYCAGPRWPKVEQNSNLRCRRGRSRRLPMHWKAILADLSRLFLRS